MASVFKTPAARALHELMLGYVSLAEDANCVDDGAVVRAGEAINLLDDMTAACESMAGAYSSSGNTKAQKAAHAAIRDALTRARYTGTVGRKRPCFRCGALPGEGHTSSEFRAEIEDVR